MTFKLNRFVSRRSVVLLASALTVLAGAVSCSSFDQWQGKTIFSPVRGETRWYSDPLPGTEEFDLALADGTRVHAWYLAQSDASAPTVLYLHGARWNMNGNVFRLSSWVDMGFNVLAVDYRGFGKSSELVPSERSAYEDTRTAFEELKRRQPDPRLRYIYGHSLGGALAIDLAASLPRGASDGVAGVIVEATFTSIPALIRDMKWGWIPFLGVAVTQRFDSLSKMSRVTEPLLIMHGTADNIVPPSMADELYKAAASSKKRLVKLPGASHSGGVRLGEPYQQAVLEFLQATESPRAISGSPTAMLATH